MKIIVGSKNPVKIESVREAFEHYFDSVEVEGVIIESGVSAQPFNDDILKGAKNRARALKEQYSADYYVGIEGGITKRLETWFCFAASCVIDKNGKEGLGITHHFPLPPKVMEKILSEGKELGYVMDEITTEKNTKQKGGAIGFFTKGVISRKDQCRESVVMALIPFLHPEHFF